MHPIGEALDSAHADVLLVTHLVNIRYLTGFTGSNALLAVFRDHSVFWTDPRYSLQAAEQVGPEARVSEKPLLMAAESYFLKRRLRRIAFERDHLRFDQYEFLSKKFSLVPVSGAVEQLRVVKTASEVDKIRKAVKTNSAAFERALSVAKPGMRESALAGLIEYQMRRMGAEGAAFETIVASGERSALPHARPGSDRLRERDLVLVDMGARQEGYTSDMTRMFHLGEPPRKVRQVYAAVLEAQLAAIDAVRPGASGTQIDKAARQVLQKHGLAERFVHSTGHGLGLEIHEDPRIGKKGKTRMKAGMVITIEPGVYLEGWGGIRIEDTVLVTSGASEVLTPTPKDLRLTRSTVT